MSDRAVRYCNMAFIAVGGFCIGAAADQAAWGLGALTGVFGILWGAFGLDRIERAGR